MGWDRSGAPGAERRAGTERRAGVIKFVPDGGLLPLNNAASWRYGSLLSHWADYDIYQMATAAPVNRLALRDAGGRKRYRLTF